MKEYQDKEKLIQLYEKYNSAYKIAEELNCNEKTVYRWMQKFGIVAADRTQGARKHKCNHNYFSTIDSAEKAYWLGFIMADGCVYKGDSKGSYRVQINLCKWDKYVLEAFNEAIESDYQIVDKMNGYVPVTELKVNSTKLCHDLMNHGVVPRKSLVCRMPDINKEFQSHFFRGYFDGDGCITGRERRWKACIASGSIEMLEDLQKILEENNIDFAIYEGDVNSNRYSLETTKHQTLQQFKDFLYIDAKFYMLRKKEKYDECISFISVPLTSNCK